MLLGLQLDGGMPRSNYSRVDPVSMQNHLPFRSHAALGEDSAASPLVAQSSNDWLLPN